MAQIEAGEPEPAARSSAPDGEHPEPPPTPASMPDWARMGPLKFPAWLLSGNAQLARLVVLILVLAGVVGVLSDSLPDTGPLLRVLGDYFRVWAAFLAASVAGYLARRSPRVRRWANRLLTGPPSDPGGGDDTGAR